MTDREMVIQHFEDCIRIADCQINHHWVFVRTEILRDAVALLKAQDAVRPGIGIIHNDYGSNSYFLHCPLDGTTLDDGDKYCRKCGRAVKWDD